METVGIVQGVEVLNWPFNLNICKMKIYLNLIIGLEIGKCPSVKIWRLDFDTPPDRKTLLLLFKVYWWKSHKDYRQRHQSMLWISISGAKISVRIIEDLSPEIWENPNPAHTTFLIQSPSKIPFPLTRDKN